MICRFKPNGEFDTTFNQSGSGLAPLPTDINTYSSIYSLAEDEDGNIFYGGFSSATWATPRNWTVGKILQ
jgi:hypothetical protein